MSLELVKAFNAGENAKKIMVVLLGRLYRLVAGFFVFQLKVSAHELKHFAGIGVDSDGNEVQFFGGETGDIGGGNGRQPVLSQTSLPGNTGLVHRSFVEVQSQSCQFRHAPDSWYFNIVFQYLNNIKLYLEFGLSTVNRYISITLQYTHGRLTGSR